MKETNFPPQLSAIHITERIIALVCPSGEQETTYKSSVGGVSQMLHRKYGDDYLVINLSERRNDMHQLHKQVIDYGWPENLAPPLERLCTVCKSIDSFLNAAPQNVVVLHCKGGLGRLAGVLSAYIDFSNIYSSDEQSLDAYGMKNFYENKLATYVQPSQRRYIHYFAGLLSGGISINNNSLFLHQIIIRGLPNNNTMQPYIKIYQGMHPIYVSGVFTTSSHTNQVIVTLDPCLQLRSDVLVKCFNHLRNHNNFNSFNSFNNSSDKDLIFRCQFHTCAINNNQLKLGKGDLDVACSDHSFPPHAQVEFVLSDSTYNWNRYECSPQEHNILIGTCPETMERCNSYEDFQGAQEDMAFNDFNVNSLSMNDEAYSRNMSSTHHQQNSYTNQQHYQQNQQSHQQHHQQQLQHHQNSMPTTYSESWDADGNPVKTHYNSSRPHYASNKDVSHRNQVATYQHRDYAQQQQMLQHQQQQLQRRAKSASFLASAGHLAAQNTVEQQQLDDILKELIEEKSSHGGLLRGQGAPSHGCVTTTGNNMSTTLSWNSTQAGATKSATVNKQTWARPAPQSNLTSQVTRSRDVLEEGDRITGGRVTSNENYNYRMPQFEESRKVNMMAEDRVFDVNSAAYRDYVNEQSQQELASDAFRGFQERSHTALGVADTGNQVAWLEGQKSKLRQRRNYSRAQSDVEDYDAGSFQRRANDSATYNSTNLLPSHHTHVAEYRDAKGRRCRTIETETFSRRCETTSNQPALMPPARSSTPSTPVIPERLECSREAYIRNQPAEVEVVELQPIGPGVQTLEPTSNSLVRHDKARSLPRDLPTTVSVPAIFTTMPRQQYQSFSKTDSYQSNQLVPAYPPTQQVVSFNGTMPGSFVFHPNPQSTLQSNVQVTGQMNAQTGSQPVLHSIKETWTQTVNPGSKTAAATVGQHQQQQAIQQSQQQQQQRTTYKQVNSANSDSMNVPVFIQNHDGSVTAPATNFNTINSADFRAFNNNINNSNMINANTHSNSNFNTMNSNFNSINHNFHTINSNAVVESQQQQQQQQHQQQHQQRSRQQYFQQQPQQTQNTMRSSSHSRLFVETPRNFSSASSGVFNEQARSANAGNSYTMSAAERFQHTGNTNASTMVAGTGASYVAGRSRNGSFSSVAGDGYDYVNQFPRFVKDSSHIWHKPNFTREDAIQYLRDKPPGSFLIRNSATYQGSYGLTLRVAEVPENVVVLSDNPELNLVRHFVIEQTNKGVQLKGSPNEPTFASLGAFVYQHSITPISLPCKLVLPEAGDEMDSGSPSVAKDVLFITSLDTESLTGPEALAKALQKTFKEAGKRPTTTEVNFKASSQGITVTDTKRKAFFRKHFPLNSITYLGLDNQDQKWPVADDEGKPISSGRVFGFVARKQGGQQGNHCHLFSETSSVNQPAQQLINFITRIMVDQGRTVTTTST